MFKEFFSFINTYLTLYLVFPAILLLGSYLTWRLKFVQVSKLKMSFAQLFKKGEVGGEGDISHYQAVAAVLAGSFGTGNISGMAVALTTGGAGALMWMWVMAFFGMVIQYANCLLGVKYRRKNTRGEFVGGPMYYLRDGLGFKSVGAIFALFLIFGAFTAGNFPQVNSMVLPLQSLGLSPLLIGIGVAICVGSVVLGGTKRVAIVASAVVPVMALLYLGTACVILGLYADKLLPAVGLLTRAMFSGGSVVGGTLGFTVMKALSTGFDRGIFATDAGIGTVPILQAGAKTKHPVVDGVVALVAPFAVMVVCSVTALVLVVTGALSQDGLESTNMVSYAFGASTGSSFGPFVVAIALVLFGYTTVLAWASCLERAVEFVWGRGWVRPMQILYILVVPVGAIMRVDLVWILADISLSLMLLINLIGVAGLSKEVIADSQAYFQAQQMETDIA